jgi:8-oxo-dGTP pyrophosphatase MutT (NUDIX family)
VPLSADHKVTLVGQFRYATNVYSWEIPEGGTEGGEDPLPCIQRELKEEAGLIAENWMQLGGEVHLSNCHSSEIGFLYLARELTRCECAPDGTEVLETKELPLAECIEMVHCGEIVDSLSIIGLLRAERFVQSL